MSDQTLGVRYLLQVKRKTWTTVDDYKNIVSAEEAIRDRIRKGSKPEVLRLVELRSLKSKMLESYIYGTDYAPKPYVQDALFDPALYA